MGIHLATSRQRGGPADRLQCKTMKKMIVLLLALTLTGPVFAEAHRRPDWEEIRAAEIRAAEIRAAEAARERAIEREERWRAEKQREIERAEEEAREDILLRERCDRERRRQEGHR